MSCSCGCSPCCCNTSSEVEATECLDPGMSKTLSYAAGFNDDMCQRRLPAYRGLKDDGTPDTNPANPLKGAVLVQTPDGDVRWGASACNDPPKKVVRVANDADAAISTNFIKRLVAKGDDACDVSLAGSTDVASGQWKLVWVASTQSWTTVPDTGEGGITSDLCTTLGEPTIIAPGTTEYVLKLGSTSLLAVGVSAKVAGYEFIITEIIDDEYVRADLFTTLTAPVTVNDGEPFCNIGFRPCPRSTAPYSDNLVSCLNGSSVAVELPENVNDVPVPGLYWRNQLGRVAFLPVPVDPITGLAEPNLILKTTPTPVAGGANLPGWADVGTGYTPITPVTAFSQVGSGPTFGTFTYDTAGIAAKPPGARGAILDVRLYSSTANSFYVALVTVNDMTAAMADHGNTGSSHSDCSQIIVPIESTSVLTMAITSLSGGAGNQVWNLLIRVVGFMS